jgi:hypothetical protein
MLAAVELNQFAKVFAPKARLLKFPPLLARPSMTNLDHATALSGDKD